MLHLIVSGPKRIPGPRTLPVGGFLQSWLLSLMEAPKVVVGEKRKLDGLVCTCGYVYKQNNPSDFNKKKHLSSQEHKTKKVMKSGTLLQFIRKKEPVALSDVISAEPEPGTDANGMYVCYGRVYP